MKDTDLYPITIIADRYNGSYSKGKFTAWNLREAPVEVEDGDIECMNFWDDYKGLVGKGETPNEALEDLTEKSKKSK